MWKALRESGRGQRGGTADGGEGRGVRGRTGRLTGTLSRSAGQPPSHPPSPAARRGTMVDRGPLLTSAIIFYLSIGAAIFEVLEEPHWRSATDDYKRQKTELLKQFPCLGQEGLDKILQVRWGRGCRAGRQVPAGARVGTQRGSAALAVGKPAAVPSSQSAAGS